MQDRAAESTLAPLRGTKIVATLGPASSDLSCVLALAGAGADVFRLNFGHGSHAEHQARHAAVRAAESVLGRPLAVMADLRGPRIRVAASADRAIEIMHVQADQTLLQAHHSGLPVERKGFGIPQARLPIEALTAKDHQDLAFALALGVDWVALSCARSAADLYAVRRWVRGRARLLAKIDRPAALDELDAILEAADALMVARADLGVELAPQEVPIVQRRIVRACRRVGKPVVVATQMLESMIHRPALVRAEASDVTGAVYDGVDALMLSAESAAGAHPIEAVAMMDRIIRTVEADPLHLETMRAIRAAPMPQPAAAISAAVRTVAEHVGVVATIAYTASGRSAMRMAHQRPASPLIGLTPSESTARALALVWGVSPQVAPHARDLEDMVEQARRAVAAHGIDASAGPIAIVAGMPFGLSGSTNLLHLVWPEEYGSTASQLQVCSTAASFEMMVP